ASCEFLVDFEAFADLDTQNFNWTLKFYKLSEACVELPRWEFVLKYQRVLPVESEEVQ
ncbi:unnamed protein product, partial [Prorocentrum cordatum]